LRPNRYRAIFNPWIPGRVNPSQEQLAIYGYLLLIGKVILEKTDISEIFCEARRYSVWGDAFYLNF